MRSLILVAVILQLTVTIIECQNFQFGDLIAFPGKCCGFTYNHFAVYVGDEELTGKKPGRNIFERTGPVFRYRSLSDCVFRTLDTTKEHHLFNYLDRHPGFTPGTPEQITQRILQRHKKCGTYWPRANNCEHLATYVRYGVSISLQLGKDSEQHCQNSDFINTDEIKKVLEEMRDEESVCTPCRADRGRGSG